MKMPDIKISKKQIIWLIVFGASVLLYLILTLVSSVISRTQKTQHSAALWDEDGQYSMVSVFFKQDGGPEEDVIARLEYSLDNLLVSEALEAPSENARLYVAAYSRKASISMNTNKGGTVSCTAYGVKGDFFRFHPYTLISGCYLLEDNVMKDTVVIDEEAAWKLFGAIEVDGMQLTYNGKEYTVVGVVKPENAYMTKEGGAEGGTVYLPMSEIPQKKITCLEIIFPNPVSGFAVKYITKALNSIGYDEKNIVITSNTGRYSFINSLKRIAKWNRRGMSFKEIMYPYWENSAVAVENVVDLFTVLRLLAVAPAVLIVIVIVYRFHPVERFKDLISMLTGKIKTVLHY